MPNLYDTKLPLSQDIKFYFSMLLGNSSSSLPSGYRELFLYFSVNSACFSFLYCPCLSSLATMRQQTPLQQKKPKANSNCVLQAVLTNNCMWDLSLEHLFLEPWVTMEMPRYPVVSVNQAQKLGVQKSRATLVSPAHIKTKITSSLDKSLSLGAVCSLEINTKTKMIFTNPVFVIAHIIFKKSINSLPKLCSLPIT